MKPVRCGVSVRNVSRGRTNTGNLFDEPWYPGEAVGTVQFVEQNGRTTVTMTMLYDSKGTRDAVLQSPMEQGVSAGYDMLDAVLASLTGQEITS